MAITPNIGLLQVIPSQTDPDVPVNSATTKLDNSINRALAKTVTTANVTLTETEFLENGIIITSGAMTGARDLIVPVQATIESLNDLTIKKKFNVVNNCTGGFSLVVKTAAGSGIALDNGDCYELYCDGTDVIKLIKSA